MVDGRRTTPRPRTAVVASWPASGWPAPTGCWLGQAARGRRSGGRLVPVRPALRLPAPEVIRDRYPELPDSPAPVVACLQVVETCSDRDEAAVALLTAVCNDTDRRGITRRGAYPNVAGDAAFAGPSSVYEQAGLCAWPGGSVPVIRRELAGRARRSAGATCWRARRLGRRRRLAAAAPEGPNRRGGLFRLPEKPKRPNPFGEDE